MRAALVVAALAALSLSPSRSRAEEPATPLAADPRWSLGAGLSFGAWGPGASFSAYVSSVPPPSVPAVGASLERRLGARTWLVVGAAGAAVRERGDESEEGLWVSRDDQRALYLTAGVRHALTARGAPVEVSALALAQAGLADADQRFGDPFRGATRQDATSRLAGVEGGLAVDRVLTGPLSLRLATPLVLASCRWDRVDVAGGEAQDRSLCSVAAVVAPRLELRLAF